MILILGIVLILSVLGTVQLQNKLLQQNPQKVTLLMRRTKLLAAVQLLFVAVAFIGIIGYFTRTPAQKIRALPHLYAVLAGGFIGLASFSVLVRHYLRWRSKRKPPK